jgi:hypothetical protein
MSPILSESGRTICAGFVLLFVLVTPTAHAAKTDIVVLKNGDRITGEVKGLDKSRLRYSTDAMGTIYIEWDDIETLISKEYHRLQLTSGRRYYGTLSDAGGAETLAVPGVRGMDPVPLMDVVRIVPVEEEWQERIDLTVGAGYTYVKASDVTTANVYAEADYVSDERVSSLDLTYNLTDDGDETNKSSRLTGQHKKLRQRREYLFLLGQAEQNDELDVDLRGLLGGGYGKHFVQNNRRKWLGAAGAGVAHEESGDGESNTELEGILQTTYEDFLYDTPKIDLSINLFVFPGITDFGRVRSNYDVQLRKEFIEDLFLDFTIGGSYDSDPTSDDASKTDYSVTTGVSYDF